jgi:hypothetical protein
LAVLSRDIVDGASPGSQPEQVLLAKEAERLRLLERRPGKLERGVDADERDPPLRPA